MMKPLRFFMPPEQWFAMLEEFSRQYFLEVIFRRFETPEHPAGYHLAGLDALQETYADGDYRYIVLSVGAVPAHDQDWEFTSHAEDDLIDSRGGNWEDDRVGIRSLQLVSKTSRAERVFKEFRRSLFEVCKLGMESEDTPEADILYLPDTPWRYMSGPEADAEEYLPI